MRKENYKLSLVVPMYFEEEVALVFHGRATAAVQGLCDYEIVYINDGSTDQTLPILRDIAKDDPHVRVLSFSRNFGHQAAVTAGLEHISGDVVVVIDADLQDPPEMIPDMVKMWQDGWDVVYAKRKKRKGESAFKLLTAKVFYRFLAAMTDVDIPNDTGDFRLMDRKVVNAFRKMPEHNRFIRGMVAWLGFKQAPIEYERDARFAGETKYPFKKMLKLAADGIYSFSTKPLKMIARLGVLCLLLSVGILLLSLVMWLCKHSLGWVWTSIMFAITFFSGVQLLCMGVLGVYTGRSYDENRGRPLFLIDEVIEGAKEEDR